MTSTSSHICLKILKVAQCRAGNDDIVFWNYHVICHFIEETVEIRVGSMLVITGSSF